MVTEYFWKEGNLMIYQVRISNETAKLMEELKLIYEKKWRL